MSLMARSTSRRLIWPTSAPCASTTGRRRRLRFRKISAAEMMLSWSPIVSISVDMC
jgi:hypothetical protein